MMPLMRGEDIFPPPKQWTRCEKIASRHSLSRPLQMPQDNVRDWGIAHFDKLIFRDRKRSQKQLEIVMECAVHLSGTAPAPVLTKKPQEDHHVRKNDPNNNKAGPT